MIRRGAVYVAEVQGRANRVLSMHGVCVHVLRTGDRFDLKPTTASAAED